MVAMVTGTFVDSMS